MRRMRSNSFASIKAATGLPSFGLLDKIIARLMKLLTRQGYLVEEQGMTYLADMDADNRLASLQAASYTYRIALGPRAGQKVLSLRTVSGRDRKTTADLCADAHGVSLHAGVRCGAHQRQELERLCHYITRLAIANERQLRRNTHVSYGSTLARWCRLSRPTAVSEEADGDGQRQPPSMPA